MSQLALDLGVPSTLVTEAVYARCLSAHERRPRAREQSPQRPVGQVRRRQRSSSSKQIRQALYASKICSYAQGFVQMQAAAKEHNWPLELRRHRTAVARRLHHSGRVPRSHQGSVRRRSQARKPAARTVLHRSRRQSPGLAGGTSSQRPCELGHSGAGVHHRPGLLRRLSAATACRPTCCKPSAITSAPTRTSAPTNPARSTPTGFASD